MATAISSDCYQLKWHSFSSHMHASIATLMQSDCYADVILCTHDGGQVKAHRFILSVCSNYFQTVFKTQSKMIVSLPLFVMMPLEIDHKTLKTLVHYIYCGETTVSNDILEGVLKAGDLLKIRGLWRPKDRNTPPPLIHKKSPENQTTTTQSNQLKTTGNQTTADANQSKDETTKTTKAIPGLKVLTTNEILAKADAGKLLPSGEAGEKRIISLNSSEGEGSSSGIECIKAFSIMKPSVVDGQKDKDKAKTDEGGQNQGVKRKSSDEGYPKQRIIAVTEKHLPGEIPTIKLMLEPCNPGTTNTKSIERGQKQIPCSSYATSISSDDVSEDGNLYIKDEPRGWELMGIKEDEEESMLHTELTIKPEEIQFEDDDDYGPDDGYVDDAQYPPLSCELCAESFEVPTDWLKHIGKHSDLHQPAKRQRRGQPGLTTEEEGPKLPPLLCDLCQKSFPTPAEWVRHIQQTHTERELAISNNSAPPKKPIRACTAGLNQKVCTTCDKKFPSHASMVIHARTHTGERPFLCTFCNKGFNVKSNLLRHLRTLHDRIINSGEVNDKERFDDSRSSV